LGGEEIYLLLILDLGRRKKYRKGREKEGMNE
jgi:hypothetical protein